MNPHVAEEQAKEFLNNAGFSNYLFHNIFMKDKIDRKNSKPGILKSDNRMSLKDYLGDSYDTTLWGVQLPTQFFRK
jgi:hypothetical protein